MLFRIEVGIAGKLFERRVAGKMEYPVINQRSENE